MKKNFFSIIIIMICLCGFLTKVIAFAGSEDIKQRMKDRLPAIVALKNKGIIGEDNKGFLQFVGSIKESNEIIAAENADRQKVYEAIAAREGSTSEAVGIRRAMQISEKAGAGEWLQDSGGKWYKK
jgi:uncharacterized protein YdbL (DUF1318 family)